MCSDVDRTLVQVLIGGTIFWMKVESRSRESRYWNERERSVHGYVERINDDFCSVEL